MGRTMALPQRGDEWDGILAKTLLPSSSLLCVAWTVDVMVGAAVVFKGHEVP